MAYCVYIHIQTLNRAITYSVPILYRIHTNPPWSTLDPPWSTGRVISLLLHTGILTLPEGFLAVLVVFLVCNVAAAARELSLIPRLSRNSLIRFCLSLLPMFVIQRHDEVELLELVNIVLI